MFVAMNCKNLEDSKIPLNQPPLYGPPTAVDSLTNDDDFLVIIGNKEFIKNVPNWQREVRRRFPTQKVLLYFGHGGVSAGNSWMIRPDNTYRTEYTNVFAWKLHNAYKSYIIVLVTCNPVHEDLYIPNVYYAKDDVWVTPDADAKKHSLTRKEWAQNISYMLTGIGTLTRETDKNSFLVGSIDEFITEGKHN
jgi:hypothetical protein